MSPFHFAPVTIHTVITTIVYQDGKPCPHYKVKAPLKLS